MTILTHMLDTNILSDVIRNPYGKVAARMEGALEGSIGISAIVASELRFGAQKRQSARLIHFVENTLARLPIVSYDEAASHHYAAIRHLLEQRGLPIGTTDLFIAAHARSLGLTLVTNNVREFSRVDGLTVENWLEVPSR